LASFQLNRESLHLSLKLPLALAEPSAVASPVNLVLSRLVPLQMTVVLEYRFAPDFHPF